MPVIVPEWLSDYVELKPGANAEQISSDLVRVGIEEESIIRARVTGPLVVGRVLAKHPEPQKNGKVINWCLVDVGSKHNTRSIKGVTEAELVAVGAPDTGARGIVCGADNFTVGDLVVVALPGTVLPGPFPIAARKTYGHVSDGMICSVTELGFGDDGAHGIIVLPRDFPEAMAAKPDAAQPGSDAVALLGLGAEALEVNITPDRGYQFSYRGIAREYALATGGMFTDPVIALAQRVPTATNDAFPVEIDDTRPIRGISGCDRFITRIARDADPQAISPSWIQQRLALSGMRAISLPVDVTNYAMLELGQPVHAYDLDKVAAPIVVRRANSLGFGPGEKLTTLDGIERALDDEDLLITDSPGGVRGSRVLGLAGVMGGASTEISAATTNILVECAHFDPVSVARTARRHKLPTEAAKRFERGVDPELAPPAAQRVIDLLVEFGGGVAGPEVGDLNSVASRSPIMLPAGLPEKIVGVAYEPAQIKKVLTEIGCEVHPQPDGALSVAPPSWRPDLTEPVDLVEEIARISGYDQIPSVLPAAPGSTGLPPAQRAARSAARALAEAGLVEVLSYPFVGPADWAALQAQPEGLRLANPLAADRPAMRTSLLVTLLDTARRNYSRGITDFGIYEIGLVTPDTGGGVAPTPPGGQAPSAADLEEVHNAVPNQPRHLAAALVGMWERPGWWNRNTGRPADWSDALGLATLAAERAGAIVAPNQVAGGASWHPGRSAELVAAGRVVGVAGELHPSVCANFGLPKRSVAFELDLSALAAAAHSVSAAAPVSAFPPVREDFAFVVAGQTPAIDIQSAIESGAGELFEAVTLFDVYEGEQVGAGKKSLAFKVQLRSPDHTLSADEVRAARSRILAEAEKCGAALRG